MVKNNEIKRPKHGKIATKITVSVTFLIVIVVAIFAIVIGGLVRFYVGDLSSKYAQSQVNASINEIDQNFKSVESIVQSLTGDIRVNIDVDRAKKDITYLRDLTDDYELVFREVGLETKVTNSIYVYFNRDVFGDVADAWVYGDDFKRQDQIGYDYYDTYHEWFNRPIDEKKAIWTFPYVGTTEATKNSLISSYVKPIIKDGEVLGIVGMDFDLKAISEELSKVQLYDTGYLYMIDPKGNVIIHKSFPWIDTDNDGIGDQSPNVNDTGDYQFLIDDMASNDSNVRQYKRDDGVSVTAAYGHLNNGWIIGSSIPESEVFSISNLIVMIIVGIGIIAVLISTVIALLISKSISHPIIEVVGAVNKIKDGDFTVKAESKSNDETKELADSVNTMVEHIRSLINDSKNAAGKLVDASTTLASMVQETNATIEQVGTTVSEISKATQETAGEAERSTQVVKIIDQKFDLIVGNSDQMYQTTQEVNERKNSGLEAIHLLKDISESSEKSNEKISHAVGQLDSRTKAITDIISTINSIAEQTNLLALNASIEAARAGEAGKGFAVVAEEIRKLAEDSGNATEEIRNIINTIQVDTQETVKIMGEVNKISKDQREAVYNVNDIFEVIFGAIDGIVSGIETISSELTEMNSQKDKIVEISSTLSAVSEETAAATEEVNASMTDQMQAIEEVSKSADVLSQLSKDLSSHIEIFKI